MNDFYLSFSVILMGGGLCYLTVKVVRPILRKIATLNIDVVQRMQIEYEFVRLAWQLEKRLGQLSSEHYGLIESWPESRMREAIKVEKENYTLNRRSLISEYENKFQLLVTGLSSSHDDLLDYLLDMHSEEFPSLGLINLVS